MDFVAREDKQFKLQTRVGDYNYLPTGNMKLTIDSAQVIATGTVRPDQADRIVKEMTWTIKGNAITRNHLMVLDLLAQNNWKRPIYFAVTVGGDNYLGLERYFHVEGLAYRLVPIETTSRDGQTGEVNTVAMYDNMVNKFKWGNMDKPEVYQGTETERMSLNYRSMYARLANALIAEGKKAEALKTLDRCMEAMPHESILLNFSATGIAEAYYKLDQFEKGNAVALKLADVYGQEIDYYARLDRNEVKRLGNEAEIAMSVMQKLLILAKMYKQDDVLEQLEARFADLESKYLDSPMSKN
jgi:hypothetical protein